MFFAGKSDGKLCPGPKALPVRLTIVFAGILTACLSIGLGSQSSLASDDTLTVKNLQNQIAPGIMFGGEFEIDIESKRNFDLDGSKDDTQGAIEPQIELAFAIKPASYFLIFTEVELSKKYFFDRPMTVKRGELQLQIDQLFVARELPNLGTTVAFGRIDYEDELEWIYDEELDGVRLDIDFNGPLSLHASITREELFFPKDILDPRSDEQIDNYMLWLQYDRDRKNNISGYLFVRNDKGEKKPEDLTFVGLQKIGQKSGVLKKKDKLKYWVNTALVTGDDNGDDIWGFGVDVIGTYVFPHMWQPSITGGIAFGTGDNNSKDSTDHAFRQTGLQDNNAKFNGVASFKYYGELFEPELSNMKIYTLGFGLRPTKKKSIDIVYHKYHQVRANDDIRDSNLKQDPNGISKDLGQEIDLIFGYRPRENIRFELDLGAFFPGSAFSSSAENAFFGAAELRIKF